MRPLLASIARLSRPSLRMAMAAIMLASLVLGWFVNEARRRREAVAAIKRAGGAVFYDYEYRKNSLIPREFQAQSRFRRHLGPDYFDRVVRVDFVLNATDSLMPQVGRLTSLEELSLENSPVTDGGIAHLAGLVNLRRLEMNGTKATSASFASLRPMVALERLNFFGIRCDDAALVDLGRLRGLKTLVIGDRKVTDKGVSNLAALPELVDLDLSGAKIGDLGALKLGRCRTLRQLSLDGTYVTKAGVDRLAMLPDLKILSIRRTGVSLDEVVALRRAHPQVEFRH